jgi:alkanesulfonate monooxygenase SsuD/methylene tetrahydromethanopterin reductase-like flavin-dependent oxidoreductase (luciferase family)
VSRDDHETWIVPAGGRASCGRLAIPGAESGTENIDLVVRMTQAAERAKFDMVFFGDRLLTSADAHPSMITRPDPLAMLAALSMVTTHVGLAATASTTYSEPFNLARTLATVDKLSHGRARGIS